jgi:glycosyltransferase involved in cell wall biosynthesis
MRSVRVAVDATAVPTQRLGAGAYIVELLRHVDASAVDLHVLVKKSDAAELAKILPDATLHAVSVSNRATRIAWSHVVLPARVRSIAPDVFHGPHYTLPSKLTCASVVTFHDPTFFTMPQVHERKKVAYFTRAARAAVATATRVIAPSEYSRRGAIEHAGASPDRTDVVPEGADLTRYVPTEAIVDRPYILFVGALEPRKDVPSLIAAYDDLDTPHDLILVGPPRWGTDAIEVAIAGAKRSATIRRMGYVTEDEKIALYQGASAFVYPSLAEGFGLPIVEGLACGVPVITTTGSSPEEIAKDVGLLVPPHDVPALRDAMHRVLSDEELSSHLRRLGPQRAARYTWAAAASATVEVWRKACAR